MNTKVILESLKSQSKGIYTCYNKNKELIPLIAKTIKAYSPNDIIIIAQGSSLSVAYYTKYLFELYYNVSVSIVDYAIYTIYNKRIKINKTLLIAISEQGNDEKILDVLKKANEDGAITLSITNDEDSSIAKEAKYDLYTNIKKSALNIESKGLATNIYLVTKLIYELTGIPELDLEEDRVCECLEESLNYHNQIKEDVKLFALKNFVYTFSYGYIECLANELSLKIRENCFLPSFSHKDFNYNEGEGIKANNSTASIIFAIDKVTNNYVAEKIKRFNHIKYVITNKGEFLNICNKGIYINEDNDLYALFTAVGVIQIFTAELCNLYNK
ncbi:MAG: SIS domain-containing protein [Bacilli bacterium]